MLTPTKGRRNFFTTFRNTVAAGLFASQFRFLRGTPATPHPSSAEVEDYYEKLRVTKIINAAVTYTSLTASTMPPSVQAAVARAAKHPVRLPPPPKTTGGTPARK